MSISTEWTMLPTSNDSPNEWTPYGASTSWEALLNGGDTSFVMTNSLSTWKEECIGLSDWDEDITVASITKIRVEVRFQAGKIPEQNNCKIGIEHNGTQAWGSEFQCTASYVWYGEDFTTNPDTSNPWQESELDAVVACFQGRGPDTEDSKYYTRASEMRVIVYISESSPYVRKSYIYPAQAVTASRVATLERDADVAVGQAVSAQRTLTAVREAELIVGEAVTATRTRIYNRLAELAVGQLVSASRRLVMEQLIVGAEAIDRDSSQVSGRTKVEKKYQATMNGNVTQIELWAYSQLSGVVKVGTFYQSGGTGDYTCRDFVQLAVPISAGSKQVFTEDYLSSPISIETQVGDLFGIYWETGNLERSDSGAGCWSAVGDMFDYEEHSFSSFSRENSICGLGAGGGRKASIAVGINVSAQRTVTRTKTAELAIGISVTAGRTFVNVRQAALAIGIAVTAAKHRVMARVAALAIGQSVTASRTRVRIRAAELAIGTAVTAQRTFSATRESLLQVGQSVSASRTLSATRTAAVQVGIAVTAEGHRFFLKTAAVAIGISVTASRTASFVRQASLAVGQAVTASRQASFSRAAELTVGVAVSALGARRYVKAAAVQVGILVSAIASYGLLRRLKVSTVVTQHRKISTVTAQYRKLSTVTTQFRKVTATTAQYRVVKAVTAQYRKLKSTTWGG